MNFERGATDCGAQNYSIKLPSSLVPRTFKGIYHRYINARVCDGRMHPISQALDHALVRGGAGIVMLSRLSPLFPFAMTSFAYGACAVSTKDFLLGTAVGLTPGTVMMSWVGWSLREYTAHAGSIGGGGGGDVGGGGGGGGGGGASINADVRQLWVTVGLTVVSGLLLGWRVNRIIKSTAAAVSASGAKASSKTVRGAALA